MPTLSNITNMYTETELSDQEEEKDSARDDYREDIFVTVEKLQARDIFVSSTSSSVNLTLWARDIFVSSTSSSVNLTLWARGKQHIIIC